MLRIAIGQTPGNDLNEWPRVLEIVENLIRRAAGENADLILLPECVWPAYFIHSPATFLAARDAGMPSHEWFVAKLTTWARTQRIAICAGYVSQHGDRLRNTAALISDAGELLGTYDKCFLWDFDYTFFEPGDSLVPLDTPWGPVGLMICADARLPEIPATLAARGARLILQPTAWVNCGAPDELWNPQPESLIPERAREFGVPIASCSKCGSEGGTQFVGSSIICDAAGRVITQCGPNSTELIVAEVDLTPPRPATLTAAQRQRLLSTQPPRLPRADVPPLHVALRRDESDAVAATPTLLLDYPTDERATTTAEIQSENRLLLTGPTETPIDLAGIRVASLRDSDADCFGPIRAAALDGVHVIAIFGDNVADRTLCARATENRIFIVQVTPTEVTAYDPRGRRVAADAKSNALTLKVAHSANKEFAPRTNPFTERKPKSYEL